jgi:hypothetical protein
MTPRGKSVVAVALLAVLALPTGLCSLYFTPMGLVSLFGHDSLERSIGVFALICSAAGWLICGVSIWGAVRLNRNAMRESPPNEPSP